MVNDVTISPLLYSLIVFYGKQRAILLNYPLKKIWVFWLSYTQVIKCILTIENWKKVGNGDYQPLGFLFCGAVFDDFVHSVCVKSQVFEDIKGGRRASRSSTAMPFSTDEINLRALRGDHTFECSRARSRCRASSPLSEALNCSILPKWSMNLNLPMKALYPGEQGAVYLGDCCNFVSPWLPTWVGKSASCELISLDGEIINHPSPKNT